VKKSGFREEEKKKKEKKGNSLGDAKCALLKLASWIIDAFRDDCPPRIDDHRLPV
jgi:hypothetical protein